MFFVDKYTIDTFVETRSIQTIAEPADADDPVSSSKDRPKLPNLLPKINKPIQ